MSSMLDLSKNRYSSLYKNKKTKAEEFFKELEKISRSWSNERYQIEIDVLESKRDQIKQLVSKYSGQFLREKPNGRGGFTMEFKMPFDLFDVDFD